MSIVVFLNGKNGKMGHTLCQLIQSDHSFTLTDLPRNADVIIDFSSPSALPFLIESRKPLVVGTTGYTDEQKKELQQAATRTPIFFSPNFSIGMNLLMELVQIISKRVGKEGSIDIIEAHHTTKKDIPSGTALKLAEMIEQHVPIHSIRASGTVGEHTILIGLEGEKIELKHEAHSRIPFAQGALQAARFVISQPAGYYGMQHLIQGTVSQV